MSDRLIFSIILVAVVGLGAISFHYSLPGWCKRPEGAGNWLVQPLCPKVKR